jgi:hypothetical protein
LFGGGGADLLIGGGGVDAADYSDRQSGVAASPDGTPRSGNAQDGPPGARDTISVDVEDLYGGSGPDVLTGSQAQNYIDAGPGDDIVDISDATEDFASCGDGSDHAIVDDDDITEDCEIRGPRSAPPATVQTPVPIPRAAAKPLRVTAKLAGRTNLKAALSRGIRLRVGCSESCAVRSSLTIDAKTAGKLGLTRRNLPVKVASARSGRAGTQTLHFTSKARTRLRHARALGLDLVVQATDTARNTKTVRSRLRLAPTRATLTPLSTVTRTGFPREGHRRGHRPHPPPSTLSTSTALTSAQKSGAAFQPFSLRERGVASAAGSSPRL